MSTLPHIIRLGNSLNLTRVLTATFLCLCLQSCATVPTKTQPQVIVNSPLLIDWVETIPTYLYQPCVVIPFKGETWSDLVEHSLALTKELKICKARQEALVNIINERLIEVRSKSLGGDDKGGDNEDSGDH